VPLPVTSRPLTEYLTVGQAAQLLGVSAWTLRNWDRAGKLKPHRHPINGHRLYRHEDLAAVLAEVDGAPDRGLTPGLDWSQTADSDHFVQFYESDAFLADSVAGFIGQGLQAGAGAVLIATKVHRASVLKRLQARGLDVAAARRGGRLAVLDAADTLAKFMADGLPDPKRFDRVVGDVLTRVARGGRPVRAFGEMVALLWAEGNRAAAIRLEELWNDLGKAHTFALYCAYPLAGVAGPGEGGAFADVCTCHTRVLPAETYTALPTADARLRAIALWQQKARSLEAEIAHRRAVEEALARRERELADFFENAVEGLHRVGPDGTVLWVNKAELDLLGYTRAEYVGRHIAEFHLDRAVIDDMLARISRGETLRDVPARMRAKDGSVRHVRVSSNGHFEGGRLAYTRCFTRDETDRVWAVEALRDSERRFAGFMQNLPGLAWIKDPDGRYVYANAAAERAFRTPRADLYGRTDDEVFPPETASQFRANDRKALMSPAGVQVVETLAHPDGAVRHALVAKFPIPGPDGAPAYVGGMAVDITDRVRAEEALKEADRRKDEFLATLAHELRNPLAPIRNALEILRMTGGGERVRETMERQVAQLTRLVDDLLDVSRITRGKVKLRAARLDLRPVVEGAVETSRPLVEAAGHRLSVSLPAEPLAVEADPVRLAQIVTNLLNNAAKYTEEGGRIWLTVERAGPEAVIRVRDTGIGIPAEMLHRVFEMFTQVERPGGHAPGGLGIGLALVKRLAELHGGRVEVHSDGPGQGSEFTVRLPLMPGPEA
jgi:PAS domain S-box-containing protein